MQHQRMRQLATRAALYGAALAALLGVFALYQRPDFLLTLADRVWSCF